MTKASRIQYFENEGRDNLSAVVKSIRLFLRDREGQNLACPKKIVMLTREGEGPYLAYQNGLHSEDNTVIAVTFPLNYAGRRGDQQYIPEIPDKLRKFFNGVGIPIITNRLPFEDINGANSHNHEMSLLRDALAIFGGSVPLAIQAVLQAADAGEVQPGEVVISATGDTALLITASTTRMFLRRDEHGLTVNEIICKPRILGLTKKRLPPPASPDGSSKQIEGTVPVEQKPK